MAEIAVTENETRFNSAVVLEKGRIIDIYNKEELLPFTEKSPAFSSFLKSVHIEPLSAGGASKSSVLETQHGKFSPIICSEIIISNFKKNYTEEARFLVNISNDNVFDSKRLAENNKIITKIRAIENKIPIIRASKGGFSGAYDANGREIPASATENGELLFLYINIP